MKHRRDHETNDASCLIEYPRRFSSRLWNWGVSGAQALDLASVSRRERNTQGEAVMIPHE